MKNKFYMVFAIIALVVSINASSQTDDPNNNINGFNTTPIPTGGTGSVLGSFNAPIAGLSVGLEHDGSGNLLNTELNNDDMYIMDTAGNLVSGPTSVAANSLNALGITTNGTNIFITDTDSDDVDVYDLAANYVSSFDVSTETTFPEGIAYSPIDNTLYVVNGSGGNIVMKYDMTGSLLNTFPINGSSQDGIALDYQRCVFWIYDSGTDTVRSYDSNFTEIETFAGTAAAGFGNGEGLAVIGNSLFVMASGSNAVVEFDISSATPAANAATLCAPPGPPPVIPTLSNINLLVLALSLLFFGGLIVRRFS